MQGKVKTIQIKCEGNRWYLILSCDDVPALPLPETGMAVGIDAGTTSFATTSDGTHINSPRWARKGREQLEIAQQRLSGKKRGSNNRRGARETVASRHRKIANQRKDLHYKVARALVADHDVIVVEDLKIENMVRRAKPVPDPANPGQFPPNGQAAKSELNRSIHDASWGALVAILEAKTEEAGRRVVTVDPRHTSDRCEACGYATKENRVSQAVFRRVACGHSSNADDNKRLATSSGPDWPF